MQRPWQDDKQSLPYKMLGCLAALSVESPEGQIVRCGAKYFLTNGWRITQVSSAFNTLKRDGYLQTIRHKHGQLGGLCADQIITPKGMNFARESEMRISAITWTGFPRTTTSAPKKEARVMDEIKKPVEPPPTERISVPGVMTEKENMTAQFLLSQAREIGSNGTSEKRVVNPAEMLEAEGLAQNLAIALEMVSVLEQHGVLRKVGEQDNDSGARYIYAVKDMAIEAAQTISLSGLQKDLHRRLRESQRKMSKLRDKRDALCAERDRINAQISALNAETEKVSAEEGAINAKLAKFDNLLRELQKELSL